MKTLFDALRRYGLILLMVIAIYNVLDEVPLLSSQLDAKAAVDIYRSFQPAYTSEPAPTDYAYPQNQGWKGRKGEVNPILENVPNHIFYIAIFIMTFAMSGFMVIMAVNAGKSWV